MSFRNRLALFFVVIVIVPMLAVAFLLFRLIDRSETGQAEAAISQQAAAAGNLLDEQREGADAALTVVGGDRVFAAALGSGDLDRAGRRAAQLVERPTIARIVLVRDDEVIVNAGDRGAVAPAVQGVESSAGQEFGSLQVAGADAPAYAARARKLTGLHVVVVNGSRVLASTLPAIDPARLPTKAGAPATIAGVEYRVQSTPIVGFTGQRIRVYWLGSLAQAKADLEISPAGSRAFVGVVLLGFLLLALACAALVSRTLQRQIAEFLAAAQRLAGGDFSARVPTVGRDEFALLGEEFNKMSGELERRLGELRQERERVQGSMRRLGEAVAANLDRDALLELVVRTAVDGVGAEAGRAHMRVDGVAALQERSRVGDINGLEPALATVEADAFASGRAHEATVGHATAMAHPLRGADGHEGLVGVVSIGRSGRPFSSSDRELLAYLASQAARSLENVERHETAARESVTDDLTGLANRRAFDDGLAGEIERAKRFDSDLGLVLIDLDNFKSINDTYGHLQGDQVLREVAGVLRESSREIDLPARYGGEELVVVLPGTDLDGAFNRSERVRAQIAALRIPLLDGGGVLTVTASCGVGAVRGESADGRGLVQATDNALYEAKRSGKNKSVRAR